MKVHHLISKFLTKNVPLLTCRTIYDPNIPAAEYTPTCRYFHRGHDVAAIRVEKSVITMTGVQDSYNTPLCRHRSLIGYHFQIEHPDSLAQLLERLKTCLLPHPSSLMLRTIWTYGYRPFILGGNCDYILATEVPTTGPHDVGQGYYVYKAKAPNGKTFIAEIESHAIVGSSLEQVRADIQAGDNGVMKKQVLNARQEYEGNSRYGEPEFNSPHDFWEALRCLRETVDA